MTYTAEPFGRRWPVRYRHRGRHRCGSPGKHQPFKVTIDDWLRADLDVPRKQRHNAKRVRDRLFDEQGASDVSYSTVRDYVARRRPEIAAAAGRTLSQAFVPQTHELGDEAEVDFADAPPSSTD